VENNQVSLTTSTGFRLPPIPGFKGETANKGDGVIADPATELDAAIKAGQLTTPLPGPELIEKVFAPAGDAVKGLVDYVITSTTSSRKTNPDKADSPVWQDLRSAGKGVRTDGKYYYEWDYTHNDIEMYNHRGEHMGSVDPTSGEIYKPPVTGRKLKNR
jgi:filamentous hemagglutinin